jgi:hypothetical protein
LEAGISELFEEHADLAWFFHKAIFQDNTAQHAASTAMKAVLSKLAHGALPMPRPCSI